MAHNSLDFSLARLGQQICQTLGQQLPKQELESCLDRAKILQPNIGKALWQATEAKAGIYIILTGKARLIDRGDRLIASLEAGTSFGELTLFPEKQFQPYAVRASVNLKCYLSGKLLQDLIFKYPSIQEHLYHQALVQDLLLTFRSSPHLRDAPVNSLMQMLSLLEAQTLNVGLLPSSLVKGQQLWLLHRGELAHPSGKKLQAGSIYAHLDSDNSWQVTQPSKLYTLSSKHWQTALDYLPQLVEIIGADADNQTNGHNIAASAEQAGRENLVQPATKSRWRASTVKRVATKFQIPNSQAPTFPGQKPQKNKINRAYFPSPTVKVGQWWQKVTRRYPIDLLHES